MRDIDDEKSGDDSDIDDDAEIKLSAPHQTFVPFAIPRMIRDVKHRSTLNFKLFLESQATYRYSDR